MADIASSDVTIAILKNRMAKGSPGAVQRNLVSISFGNATLTYPDGGVPVPTYPSFGMRRELQYLILVQAGLTGVFWVWDYTNKKLRGFISGSVIAAAGAGTIDDYALDGTAEPYVAAARQPSNGAIGLGLLNTAAAGTIYLGALKEFLAAEHAPAAQVLIAEAVGW